MSKGTCKFDMFLAQALYCGEVCQYKIWRYTCEGRGTITPAPTPQYLLINWMHTFPIRQSNQGNGYLRRDKLPRALLLRSNKCCLDGRLKLFLAMERQFKSLPLKCSWWYDYSHKMTSQGNFDWLVSTGCSFSTRNKKTSKNYWHVFPSLPSFVGM